MDSNYSSLIEEMTNMIIRPHRDTYLADKLGPSQLIIKSKNLNDQQQQHKHKYIEVVRKDLTLEHKMQKIQLSYFTALENVPKNQKGVENRQGSSQAQSPKKCVIYLHANSGSRIQGLELVKYVLPYGWSMAIFDYRGSGISEGQYTSMGVNQSEDLEKVMQYLSSAEQVGEYSLWGRSMGAVTILYYLTKQHYVNHKNGIHISSIVLDSPFSNMRKLMYEIGANNVGLPQFVFLPVVNSITDQLIGKMGFNLIAELDLVARVKQIHEKNGDWEKMLSKINCLFLTSTQDKLVNHSHVQLLHRQYPFAHKELHFFNGQHNQVRPDSLKAKCAEFLCQNCHKPGNQDQRFKLGLNLSVKTSNPAVKRTEMPNKPNPPPSYEQNRKQPQIVPPPLLKTDPCSPKLKRASNAPSEQEKIQSGTKPQINMTNVSRQSKQETPQDGKSTIIINNNYNVNVNVFGKGPIEIMPEIIPPINLKEQGGSMTDRISDNHNYNFKFYMPYTAKVERKNYDLQSSNISNFSNTSNSSIQSNSMHSSSYIEGQATADKDNLYHSAKVQHQLQRQSYPIQPQHKQHGHRQGQKIMLTQQREQVHQHNRIQIPLIKFDSIEVKNQKPYMIARKIDKNVNFEQKVVNSPKVGECFLSKKDPQASQKQKLSLSQLRKIQKQVQQKSDLKASKVLYMNKQKSQKEQELLNYKKEDIFQDTEAWNYKSEENTAEAQRTRNSKDMKSMKTSLMAKRKVFERKNSDSLNPNELKYSTLKKEEQPTFQPYPKPTLDTQGVTSQKRLHYKIRIDHL